MSFEEWWQANEHQMLAAFEWWQRSSIKAVCKAAWLAAQPDIEFMIADLLTDGTGRRGKRLIVDYEGDMGGSGWGEDGLRSRLRYLLGSDDDD